MKNLIETKRRWPKALSQNVGLGKKTLFSQKILVLTLSAVTTVVASAYLIVISLSLASLLAI
jgi:hypothetical protein